MINFKHIYKHLFVAATVGIAAVTGLSSCGLINDDLDPCAQGVELRFVYDYNMEFANAFPSQVDCLTLLVYDDNGNYIKTITETAESKLSDENWRMTLDLPGGKYQFIAYGGLECDKSTFHFVNTPAKGSKMTDLQVAMDDYCINADPGVELHHLFYGALEVEVPDVSTGYTQATLYMMKDTNNIRILLQNVDGAPVDPDDYIFTIVDDNALLAYNNDCVPGEGITYTPWATGQVSPGTVGTVIAELGYAEFSTSRLIENSGARLVIKNAHTQNIIIDIPLVNYLTLLRSQQFANMSDQEFLDRESRWSVILFLEAGYWLNTRIIINDWVVRINSFEP